MSLDTIPGDDEIRHPLFIDTRAYCYRVTITKSLRRVEVIAYSEIYEVILNLWSFASEDIISYLTKGGKVEVYRVNVLNFTQAFSLMLHSISGNQDELEQLYMQLSLANWHSTSISDKGRFRQLHYNFSGYLIGKNIGIDMYLDDEAGIVWCKYRGNSLLHLFALLKKHSYSHNQMLIMLKLPKSLNNLDTFVRCLCSDPYMCSFQISYYLPTDQDNMLNVDLKEEVLGVIEKIVFG